MEQKKVNIIHYLIVLALCFGFRFIPGVLTITPQGMAILGCFLGAIYGWIMIDMLWPSIIALAGMGLTIGWTPMLQGSFGSEVCVALILSMGAVGIAMKNGAFNWLAVALLNNKLVEGKGFLAIFIIFMAAWFMGAHNPIIMCVIFCGFLTAMFKQVGVKKDDPLVIFSFLGVAYQLMRGQILFPFVSTGLVYIRMYQNALPDVPMPVPQYLLMMTLMGIIMAIVFIALMKFVFRVDASPLANYKLEGGVPKCTRDQKFALGAFVVFILLNIFNVLSVPVLTPFLNKFGLIGICMMMGAAVVLFPGEDGKPIANLEELYHMCNWGQITMVGFIMLLSTYMVTADTGIGGAMAVLFYPFMKLPPIVFIAVVMVIGTILTNIANNMIVTVICMPFLIKFASLVGLNPVAMVALLFIISEFALATPAASPVTAVAMSQEMVTPGAMSKAALKILPFLFVTFMIIGWPLALAIF
ncbi:MAG: hypothetical protein IIX62_05925 [Peptococcaceae bacterium]|nr:hypothetical protein [Peptococcaceae bacterium]